VKGVAIMPTQEERLTTLERSQIETNKNMTILLGVVSEQQKDIKRILLTLDQHTTILTQHSQMLQAILARLPEPK